mmetsp:Transcript_84693/g.238286  ORF Transcript_84693/g.238286 Transcript_84693/m.238286 type:complete len:612 (+) Transcript_84693:92-1927(+)
MEATNSMQVRADKLGYKLKTIQDLQKGNIGWAVAFDMVDKAGDGFLTAEESLHAFRKISGGSSAQIPEMKFKQLFEDVRLPGCHSVDFRSFHQIITDATRYMVENPQWERLEEDACEEQRHQARRDERARKQADDGDLYKILGITKCKDIKEMECRKEQALERAQAASKLRYQGLRVLEAQRVVCRMCALKLTELARPATIEEVTGNIGASSSQKTVMRRLSGTGGRLERGSTIDLPTDIPDLKFRGIGSACFTLRFSPDGSQLAAGYFDGFLRIFDATRGCQLNTMSLARPSRVDVHNFDSAAVEKANRDGTATLTQHDDAITNLRWMPQGLKSIVATVDTAGTLGLWDLTKGRQPSVLDKVASSSELNALAFSRDGERVLVAGQSRSITVYQVKGGNLVESAVLGSEWSGLGRIAAHRLKVLSLSANPACPDVFVSGGLDKQILVWDLRAGSAPVAVLSGTELSGDALDMSRDGMTLLAGSHRIDRPLQLFDMRLLSPRPTEVRAMSSYEWSGSTSMSQSGGKADDSCMLFSASWDAVDNRIIAAAGERDSLGRVFRRPVAGSEKPLEVLTTVSARGGAIYASAVSEDARYAAFGGTDGSVQFCDLRQL